MSRAPRIGRLLASTGLPALALLASTVLAGPASASAAQGLIAGAGAPTAIAGSYIVTLKNTEAVRARGVAATARELARGYGGSVEFVYRSALHGFSATMSEAEAKRLAARSDVATVEQNQRVWINDVQTNPPSWGLDRIDQRNLPLSNSYTFNTTASNVTAFVIDTGIRVTHNDFGGRATVGTDTVGDGRNGVDCNGHGTHVAGTVGGTSFGVAKGVRLVAVRVLNCAGSGTIAGVTAGVDFVTRAATGAAVANMSLGGGASATLDNAVANSINSGVSYAVAAGNSNQNACNFSPARVPAAITAGATDINDNRASFSNVGTCLDIFAPGVNITSAWRRNNTDSRAISGTSMASPHVAGAAALILASNPNATAQQVRDAMVANATTGVVINPGSGSQNRLVFTL
jgi:subtilisin family serine protease